MGRVYSISLIVLGVIYLSYGILAQTTSVPVAPIELAVLFQWENIDQAERVLPRQSQLLGIQTTAEYLSEQLGTDVMIAQFTPSVGKTPFGRLHTIASLTLDPRVGNPELVGGRVRSLLGIDKLDAQSEIGPILHTLVADIPVKILRNQSNEAHLREKVMQKIAESGGQVGAKFTKRDFNSKSTGRNTLAYEGLDAEPQLRSILVEPEIRFGLTEKTKISKDGTGGGNQRQTATKAPTVPLHQYNGEGRNWKDESVRTGLATSRASGEKKRFKPKYFVSGPQAQDVIRASDVAGYNLDILNSGNGQRDGNKQMPVFFFPPLQQPHAFLIDTVVDLYHVELFGRVDQIWDANPTEIGLCESHGTGTATIMGGATLGVNRNLMIHSLKTINCEGFAYTSDIMTAIATILEYCTNVLGGKQNNGIVVNMSLGGSGDPNNIANSPFHNIINQTVNECDALFIAAAGNSHSDACLTLPAGFDNVMAIGATDINNAFASFSNFGSCVDISGSGVDIVTAGVDSNSTYVTSSGTSDSCPLATGVASLHLSRRPTFWNRMFPQNLFSSNIKIKMLSDGINAVTNLPNFQTTTRLLQVNDRPISTTQVLNPLSPIPPPPPGSVSSTATSISFTGLGIDLYRRVGLIELVLGYFLLKKLFSVIIERNFH